MKLYALVGKSGTGKSYQAINLCKKLNIESIIDDGLFIYRGKSVAGTSAKREETKVGAIKRAIFNDESHREEVAETIKKFQPESLLILGTSDSMVERIAERLDLGTINELINIEDITTEYERRIAYKQRNNMGKHVVPVAAFQLKYQFSGYFLSPLRILRNRQIGEEHEKTVVRPTYSYLGKYTISEKVFGDIIRYIGEETDGIKEINKVIVAKRHEILHIEIVTTMDKNCNLFATGKKFQTYCAQSIEQMTAFSIGKMNINVKAIS